MYSAYIARLKNIRPHPNADRLQLADVMGFQVVIGLDHKDGQLGIFFPTDGQISEEFAKANDLIGYTDADGVHHGGFFDDKRKVRAQKFRGVKSEGFWIELQALYYIAADTKEGIVEVNEGDAITEINGHPLCQRYETEATRNAAKQNAANTRPIIRLFPKHVETGQFLIEASQIPIGSRIIISEKLHGTSHREGKVWVDIQLPWYKRFVNWLIRRDYYTTTELQHVIGTRNTVLSETSKDFHGDKGFRYAVANPSLHDGELLYGEIVGYTSNGALIMPAHNTSKTKDKDVVKKYGPEMKYHYGNEPGQYKLYVYRLARISRLGLLAELNDDAMRERAKELYVDVVPALHKIDSYDGNVEQLQHLVEMIADGPSSLTPAHIKEGVVLRIETPNNGRIYFLKYKSFLFRVLEGLAKEDDSYVDTEEAA